MASVFQDAVAAAIAEQPWYVRRKDSIAAGAGLVLQAANVLTAYAANFPEWVNVAVAVVIGVAQIAVHAGTKGAITPSQAARLEAAAGDAHQDLVSESGVYAQTGVVEDAVEVSRGGSTVASVNGGALGVYAQSHAPAREVQ